MLIEAGKVRDFTDADARRIWHAVQRMGDDMARVGWDLIWHAVATIGDRNARDEIVEWLDSRKWDGVARLETLCERAFGVASTEYHRAIFKNCLVACVARQYKPGTKFDHVVVLVSKQGVSKTWMLRVLFGEDHVACVPKDPTTKDSMLKTRGKLCVELDEMGALRKGQIEEVKSWVTETVDDYRDPYGRLPKRHPRRFVIVGTTNTQEFLEDDENRRWWPVSVGNIDLQYLRDYRDQLWAEAVALYHSGYEFWTIPEDEALHAQTERELPHPWTLLIAKFIEQGKEIKQRDSDGEDSSYTVEFPSGFVSSATLMTEWLNVNTGQMHSGHYRSLAKVMRALGYVAARERGPNNGQAGWVPQQMFWDTTSKTWEQDVPF
jgi:predicted P-loop ATPase